MNLPRLKSRGRVSAGRVLMTALLVSAAMLWLTRQEGACRSLLSPRAEKAQPVTPDPQAVNLQNSFAQVAALVKPAVVAITTVHVESYEAQPYQFYFGDPFEDFFREFFGEPGAPAPAPGRPRRPPAQRFQQKMQGVGSGVIVDPRGYILTNEHVVRDANQIKVTITDPEQKEYTGKVVGKDPRTDLAVVKIQPKGKLTFATLADSDKVRVGDWALAVGSPFGLEQTVTVGVISAVRQSLSIEGRAYSNLLQTDAAINRGNSGGPLINIRGEVIGINTAIYAPTGVFAGIGFAIPSNRAKEIMDQLIERGRVVRGWMGVEIAPLDEVMARQFRLPSQDGVLVNRVLPGSPAEKAGLQRGDVIVEFAGEKIATPDALIQVVTKTPPKKKVPVRIIRNGETRDVTLVTAEMPAEPDAAEGEGAEPPAEGPSSRIETWEGAHLVMAAPELARRFGLEPDTRGVMVVRVDPTSLADEIGLTEGDLILSVNRQPTPDLKTFLREAKRAKPEEGLLFDINRRGRLLYLSYRKGE